MAIAIWLMESVESIVSEEYKIELNYWLSFRIMFH